MTGKTCSPIWKRPEIRVLSSRLAGELMKFVGTELPLGRTMSNPYKPSSAANPSPKGNRRRRLISTGLTCLAIAFVCFAITVVGMMMSFNQLASERSVSPNDLAQGIGLAIVPSYIGGPLGLVGVVLTIAGLLSPRARYRDMIANARETSKT